MSKTIQKLDSKVLAPITLFVVTQGGIPMAHEPQQGKYRRRSRNAIENIGHNVKEASAVVVDKTKEILHIGPSAPKFRGVDLTTTTWVKGTKGGTRRFYVNFFPDGRMIEVYAEDTSWKIEGSFTVSDDGKQLDIKTKSDQDYNSLYNEDPDMLGAFNGVEEPGGTMMVLQPGSRKIEL